jgi:hypothetical protein
MMQGAAFTAAGGLAVRRILERCRIQDELLADAYDVLLSMELERETAAEETWQPRRQVAEAVAIPA